MSHTVLEDGTGPSTLVPVGHPAEAVIGTRLRNSHYPFRSHTNHHRFASIASAAVTLYAEYCTATGLWWEVVLYDVMLQHLLFRYQVDNI